MKNKIIILFALLVYTSFCFSQIDVIYNDLVWSDEFDTDGAVNSTNWHHQTQLPFGGSWYNGEVQHYTNNLTNSFVTNGNLHIVAKKENYTSQGVTKQYTSARLNSKFAFKYGRVDIRAKAPNDAGTWPALWLLGKNINEDGGFFDAAYGTTNWPACGEIDIMEHGIFSNQPVNYIGAAIHTPSSFGNTINKGGIQASDIAENYHIYSMNWSPNQITFLLDDVVFYTYNPIVKNADTWPFDEEQYLLLNIAMGGFAGTIPANFLQSSMIIDYVRVYQNINNDTEAPTNFVANIGEVTSSTVELLLNALDNSGTVAYTISYSGGTFTVYNPSGNQYSVVIPNLTPNTNYVFTVSAADASGNAFVNNPIVLNATTTGVLGCSGSDTESQQGTFSTGYNYTFETIGTDVKITFQLLDTDKVGVVAYLWKQNPFTEYQMTNVSGNTFTYTISGQTIGQTINYACKFAFSGGLSVTKYISYQVGENCALTINSVNPNNFWFQNPVFKELKVNSNTQIDKIEIYSMLGQLVKEQKSMDNYSIDIQNLTKGIYIVIAYFGNQKTIKKMIIK